MIMVLDRYQWDMLPAMVAVHDSDQKEYTKKFMFIFLVHELHHVQGSNFKLSPSLGHPGSECCHNSDF